MQSTLVITADLDLVLALSNACRDEATLIALSMEHGREALRRDDINAGCIVFDARNRPEEASEATLDLMRLCERSGANGMILTTVRLNGAGRDLARMTANSPILIVSELDSVMPLVLTSIRDASGTRAAVSAHLHLINALPLAAGQVLADGFAIGPRILTVSKLARSRDEHSGSLRRRLIRQGLPAPGEIVRLIRASFAIELLTSSIKSAEEVAHCVGITESTGLRRLLTKTFGVTTSEVRANPRAKSLVALLNVCETVVALHVAPTRSDPTTGAVGDQVRQRRRMLMMSRTEVARGADLELAVIDRVERGLLADEEELIRVGRVIGMDAPYIKRLLLGNSTAPSGRSAHEPIAE